MKRKFICIITLLCLLSSTMTFGADDDLPIPIMSVNKIVNGDIHITEKDLTINNTRYDSVIIELKL